MSQFNIKFYTDSEGKCDFFDYYQKLKLEKDRGNKNSRILFLSISRKLRILKRNGTRSGMPDFRYIKGSEFPIWEIRIKHPQGYFRIFIYRRNNIYYVLNYFWKKQSKTPKNEIWKAEKLIEDIESRLGG